MALYHVNVALYGWLLDSLIRLFLALDPAQAQIACNNLKWHPLGLGALSRLR